MWPTPLRISFIPLSWGYGAVVRLRAGLYRAGLFTRRRLPCRVVSIGNLTVGGTGKTPVTILVASFLTEKGYRVGVLSRGYRRSGGRDMALVSDGRNLLLGPDKGGDEPFLIARRCAQAVVAVGADRFQLGQWVLRQIPLDVLVLDDGFQHLAVERDVNLLLLDASTPSSLNHLLPAGQLREPLDASSRASAILLTRSDDKESGGTVLSRLARAGVPRKPVVRLRFFPEALTDLQGKVKGSLSDLSGLRVVVACGIANPSSFGRDVEGLGVTVVEERVWPDHHVYSGADVQSLSETVKRRKADVVLTTEKDAVKLALVTPGSGLEPIVHVVRMGIEVVEGRDELERLLTGPGTGAEGVDPASSKRLSSLY
jgi:tetraacyldisaccharide 4'-kinase